MQVVKLVLLNYLTHLTLTLVVVKQTVKVSPLLNLTTPLLQSSQRSQHQKRTNHALVSVQMVKKSNRLNSLTKPHLISKNRILVLIPTLDQPVKTLKLKIFKLPIIFKDRNVLISILSGLPLLAGIQSIHLGLHFDHIGIIAGVLLIPDVDIILQQKLMNLIVHLKLLPDLLHRNLIPSLKLLNLLRTIEHLLRLPSCIIVTHILPFYVVKLVCLSIKVQLPQVLQNKIAKTEISISKRELSVQPIVRKLTRIQQL